MAAIDPGVLSDLIHTDPACVSMAAVENEAYIQRAFFDAQLDTAREYIAELTLKRDEWYAKWQLASANTKAAIQSVINAALVPQQVEL